jgi:hypothetical protein
MLAWARQLARVGEQARVGGHNRVGARRLVRAASQSLHCCLNLLVGAWQAGIATP